MSRHDGSNWQFRAAGTAADQTHDTETPSDSSDGVSCDMMAGPVVNTTRGANGARLHHEIGLPKSDGWGV